MTSKRFFFFFFFAFWELIARYVKKLVENKYLFLFLSLWKKGTFWVFSHFLKNFSFIFQTKILTPQQTWQYPSTHERCRHRPTHQPQPSTVRNALLLGVKIWQKIKSEMNEIKSEMNEFTSLQVPFPIPTNDWFVFQPIFLSLKKIATTMKEMRNSYKKARFFLLCQISFL